MALRKKDLKSGGLARDFDGRTLTAERTSATAKKGKGKFKAKATTQLFLEANEDRLAIWVNNPGGKDLYFAAEEAAAKEEGWMIPATTKGMVQIFPGYTGKIGVITAETEFEFQYAEL